MALDKTLYRQVMGCFTTGVAILTTYSRNSIVGLTINSFCSVSLDPPLVLVCVDLNSSTLSAFRESGSFGVNILTDEQEDLSRCFATSSQARYEHFCYVAYWRAATGSPIIEGALAFIDAHIVNEYAGGDHAILLGQVQALGINNHVIYDGQINAYQTGSSLAYDGNGFLENLGSPLAYYRGQYRHLDLEYQRPSLAAYSKEQYHCVEVR
jgi:flavin reductase (DIM6/NTAB) family NADH-FMN oxidoreductase RutF